MKRILSAITPTSGLTLGNYLGSIKQFIKLQDEYEMFIFVADLHALTSCTVDPIALKNNTKNLIRSYLACGLNPQQVNLFIQSNVLEHTALGYLLMCQTTLGELNRMTQFKDKSQRYAKESNGTQKLPTGLLIYPTLMAADILLYNPDYVPVGADQKQHLELTRNIAERLNNKFHDSVFKIPEILISKEGNKIMDLVNPSVKMSKSAANPKGVIFLNDPIDVSMKKIITAKTDSLNKVNYDYENQPEVFNLINIYAGLSDLTPHEICEKYNEVGYKEFKEDLAILLKNFLEKYQHKFSSFDDKYIKEIVKNGYYKAQPIAAKQLKKVLDKLGILNNEE